MSTTEYKGYEIEYRSNASNTNIDGGRYYITGAAFNVEGYSTLNTAKGAITKHLKAQEVAAVEKAHDNAMNGDMEIIAADDANITNSPDGSKTAKWSDAEGNHSFTTDLPRVAVYFNLSASVPIPPTKHLSRNKREGSQIKKVAGRVVRSPNSKNIWNSEDRYSRKQRKAEKMTDKWLEANYIGPR